MAIREVGDGLDYEELRIKVPGVYDTIITDLHFKKLNAGTYLMIMFVTVSGQDWTWFISTRPKNFNYAMDRLAKINPALKGFQYDDEQIEQNTHLFENTLSDLYIGKYCCIELEWDKWLLDNRDEERLTLKTLQIFVPEEKFHSSRKLFRTLHEKAESKPIQQSENQKTNETGGDVPF
jgi:hypothetical protein